MTKMKVRKVTDGDTFVTQDNTKVRLANVRDLRELISRKQVKVETVARDPYGRVVAQVKVGNKSVNKAMRAKGWKDKGK
jgi:endonuclease YncB( thermonuclease family)